MRYNKKNRVLEIAIDFILKNIDKGTWKIGDRIPVIRELAQSAGVGHTSMEQAIAVLTREKIITAKTKKGIFIGNKIPAIKKNNAKTLCFLWQKTYQLLKKDVLNGTFSLNSVLPSSKELIGIYNVDFRTLKKALTVLSEQDGLIVRHKQRYHVKLLRPGSPGKTICCIYCDYLTDLITGSATKQFLGEFIAGLEKECAVRNVRVQKLAWSSNMLLGELQKIIGFIILHHEGLNPVYEDVIKFIGRFGKPIAVFMAEQWENENINGPWNFYKKQPGLFVNNVHCDFLAGREMGKFLFERGHKKICFLAHTSHRASANNYCNGFLDVFASIGISDAVTPLFFNELTQAELLHLSEKRDREYTKSIQTEIGFMEKTMASVAGNISSLFGRKIVIDIEETRNVRHFRSFFTPLFRKALAITDATAWVCHEDALACYGALQFLKSENIHVPNKMAVVGCNDLLDASLNNLTTWHFDLAGSIKKIISLIMFPEHSKKTMLINGTNIFNVEGMVIDRGSV